MQEFMYIHCQFPKIPLFLLPTTKKKTAGCDGFLIATVCYLRRFSYGKLRCPCNRKKCQNKCYLDEDTVKIHLCRYGFVPKYDCWYFHGEQYVRPFYHNVNMDVPTSSYRVPKIDYAPQTNAISDSIYFKNTAEEHVNYEDNFENEYHGEENFSTNPASDGPEGPNKGRMYGCGSMANTIYPHEMTPRPRGGGSRSSQDLGHTREAFEEQNRVIELLRVDLKASQRKNDMLEKKNAMLESRMSSLEDQVRHLVAKLPQGAPVQPQAQSSGRVLYGRSASSRGRSIASSSRGDRVAAGSSCPDPYAVALSRDERHASASSYHHTYSQVHRFSQQWVSPSQDFGLHDGADRDEDDDDADDDGAYDDDETQTP